MPGSSARFSSSETGAWLKVVTSERARRSCSALRRIVEPRGRQDIPGRRILCVGRNGHQGKTVGNRGQRRNFRGFLSTFGL